MEFCNFCFVFLFLCISVNGQIFGHNRFNDEDANITDITAIFLNIADTINQSYINEVLFDEPCFNYSWQQLISSIYNFTNNDTKNNLTNIYQYSGKDLGELGDEEECTNKNYTYVLANYTINLSKADAYYEEDDILSFLNKTKYYTGLCLLKGWDEQIKKIFNSTKNTNITDFYNTTPIQELNIITSKKKSENTNNKFHLTMSIIFICVWAFMGICTIGRLIIELIKNEQNFSKIERTNSETSENSFQTYEDMLIFKSDVDSSIIKEQKDSCVYSFFYFFDLLANLKYILSIQSKYYNDKGIELFGFLRMIIMFQLVYNHNMYTLMDMPGQDVFNKQFYTSYSFFMITASTYANVCWIVLDGAEVSYKLMNFYTQELLKINGEFVSIKIVFKFLMLLIPKIIMFFLLYFYF